MFLQVVSLFCFWPSRSSSNAMMVSQWWQVHWLPKIDMFRNQRFLQQRGYWEGNAVLCYGKRFYILHHCEKLNAHIIYLQEKNTTGDLLEWIQVSGFKLKEPCEVFFWTNKSYVTSSMLNSFFLKICEADFYFFTSMFTWQQSSSLLHSTTGEKLP